MKMSDFLDLNVTQYFSKYDSFYSGLDISFAAPSEEGNVTLSANSNSKDTGKQPSHTSKNSNIAIIKLNSYSSTVSTFKLHDIF